MERLLGMDFEGMPLPPHLPWAPVVEPKGPASLHYATGGGLLTLPGSALEEDPSGLQKGSITVGFNRDATCCEAISNEFVRRARYLRCWCLTSWETCHVCTAQVGLERAQLRAQLSTPGLTDELQRDILVQLACPDYGAACVEPGCHGKSRRSQACI